MRSFKRLYKECVTAHYTCINTPLKNMCLWSRHFYDLKSSYATVSMYSIRERFTFIKTVILSNIHFNNPVK